MQKFARYISAASPGGEPPGPPASPLESERLPQPRYCRWVTRRGTISLLLTGAAMSTAAMTRSADEQASVSVVQAIQFIRQSGDRLIAILDGSADLAVKRGQLEALINDTIDVDGIARFALGRLWNTASDGERNEYVRLFPAILMGNFAKTFGGYRGMRFSIDRATQADTAVKVSTTVVRPDYPIPIQVTWVVGATDGATKIVDICAAGVSMRIAQRDDCISLLAHDNNSVQALIETLRRRAGVMS